VLGRSLKSEPLLASRPVTLSCFPFQVRELNRQMAHWARRRDLGKVLEVLEVVERGGGPNVYTFNGEER
jgi:hypothetical protein